MKNGRYLADRMCFVSLRVVLFLGLHTKKITIFVSLRVVVSIRLNAENLIIYVSACRGF